MLISVKHHPLNNLSLSIVSLLLGYALWQSISQPHKIEATFWVPVSFYNAEHLTIDAPEFVAITLHGTRNELYKLASHLALHLDAQQLEGEKSTVKITGENLFLPDSVVLIHYEPAHVTITK